MQGESANDLERIGRNVKLARVERGWTQEELAFALAQRGKSTDRGYISRVEQGKHNPSVATLIAFARTMEVPPAKLLDGIE